MLREEFKPIRIRYSDTALGRLIFWVRRQVDLQLGTIYEFLAPALPGVRGDILDVGCGEGPFRHLLADDVRYVGVDVAQATEFGMSAGSANVMFDGTRLPFGTGSFDAVLCTEVLEHTPDPQALIYEMRRVLRNGGLFLGTVPFSARVHHSPHDFHRFTNWRLQMLFECFPECEVLPRGSDISAIASKLVVLAMRIAKPIADFSLVWRIPAFLFIGTLAFLGLIIAHLSLTFGCGSKSDPLGYSIRAVAGPEIGSEIDDFDAHI